MGACRRRRRLVVPVAQTQTVNTAQSQNVIDITLFIVLLVVVIVFLNSPINGATPAALRLLLPLLENDPRFRQLAEALRSVGEDDQSQGQQQA